MNKFVELMEKCRQPSNCNGKSKYFSKQEMEEAFKRFGCNTTSNFANVIDTVVEENFMGDTTNSLRKDTLGMVEYLERVYRKK